MAELMKLLKTAAYYFHQKFTNGNTKEHKTEKSKKSSKRVHGIVSKYSFCIHR